MSNGQYVFVATCIFFKFNFYILQALEKLFEHVAFSKYSLTSNEWLQVDACIDVLVPFKVLVEPMLQEATPTLSFVTPRFNVLISSLETLVEKGQGWYIQQTQSHLERSLRLFKAQAAQKGLIKIKEYYNKTGRVPAYPITTSEFEL